MLLREAGPHAGHVGGVGARWCWQLRSQVCVAAQVAVHGEVMVAISNANYAQPGGMLDTWAESVLRAGVRNALVVALDEATKAHAESKGLPAFQMTLEVSCIASMYAL